MKKILIIIAAVIAVIFALRTCEDYRHDYKKDAGTNKLDTGRVATIKLNTGHIIMYYNDVDSGYFTDAPECPICNENKLQQQRDDSIKRALKEIRKSNQDTVKTIVVKEEVSDSVS